MERVHVQVERDHVEKLTRPSRKFAGLAELIWNALDAEATSVRVTIRENAVGGADQVVVSDDGHGMTYEEARQAFSTLGGSWKRTSPNQHSKNKKRVLHGSEGQGRWRAFGIGTFVKWVTIAECGDGQHRRTKVTGTLESLTDFEVEGPEDTSDPVGTRVEIENIRPEVQGLLGERVVESLAAEFALYLERYSVTISFRGAELDPESLQERRDELPIEFDADHGPVEVTVIEWKREFPRSMLLCDQSGAVLAELTPGIQAPGLDFTVYVRWHGFRVHENELVLADSLGNPFVGPVIEAVRDALRSHFKARLKEKSARVIEDWKDEHVYPYSGSPSNPVEQVERQLFDVVAVAAASAVNTTDDLASRKFSLRLLKEAIERHPGSLHRVLGEVLDLPPDRLEELAELLNRTSLSDIIAAANVVTSRLDFLAGLEVLLYETDNKKALLERRQLHRILAREIWVFGDEFLLSVDDESLTNVLSKHLSLLGREELANNLAEKVLTEDGVHGVVDLMLSRAVELPWSREHLVIELKRPTVKVGVDQITQIEKYAYAVMDDERFANTDTHWDFWVISNDLAPYAKNRLDSLNLPPGAIQQTDRYTIWVKTWSQIIEDCHRRLRFVQENLNYRSTREWGVEYLQAAHQGLLPHTVE